MRVNIKLRTKAWPWCTSPRTSGPAGSLPGGGAHPVHPGMPSSFPGHQAPDAGSGTEENNSSASGHTRSPRGANALSALSWVMAVPPRNTGGLSLVHAHLHACAYVYTYTHTHTRSCAQSTLTSQSICKPMLGCKRIFHDTEKCLQLMWIKQVRNYVITSF